MHGNRIHGAIEGPIVIIGFGSIGRGVLPLLQRHFTYDPHAVTVVEPADTHAALFAQHGISHVRTGLTPVNFRSILGSALHPGKGFCINLSVDVSSLDVMRYCREIGVPYIDTVVEPWKGFHDAAQDNASRTNYALREAVRRERQESPGGTTAISCCGANPGMVSWLVKEALLILAEELGQGSPSPVSRVEWAMLMRDLGVRGIHIAERDTQQSSRHKRMGTFVNTWSVDGFLSEGLQPAELGWGTHERWFPDRAHHHDHGCRAAIWIERPGAMTRVRSWCPTPGPQFGFLITHNEAISIADYFTIGEGRDPEFRPTCHYAYHPCDDAILSLHEFFGAARRQPRSHILDEHEIVSGMDELGVLLYGHARNALWYGSRLTIDDARELAPYQNATGLQVTSAVIAGMAWALANPGAGIVEADEMDHRFCLDIQRPYLGAVEHHFTDWTPLSGRLPQFTGNVDPTDPWQFRNVLAD